jgi:hypothetical protein
MPMLSQHRVVHSGKNITHLVQHLHHRKGQFFPTVPCYEAANTTALYFGCACEYTLRVQARVVIHVNLCRQRQGGGKYLAIDTFKGAQHAVNHFPIVLNFHVNT